MTAVRVAGEDFELDASSVERALAAIDPEPIKEHYVVISARRTRPSRWSQL